MSRWTGVALGVLFLALAGCGGTTDLPADIDAAPVPIDAPVDALVIPVLRNPVTLDDVALAAQASSLMGRDSSKNCDSCHSLSRSWLRGWETQTAAAISSCFTDVMPRTQPEALAIIDCLREDSADPQSRFTPGKMGVYATAGNLEWFEYVFDLAYGADGPTQLGFFRDETLMPRGGVPPYTQEEFDIVAEWFARGLPQLDTVIPADPPPGTCTDSISPQVATHVATMRQQGWKAYNEEAGLNMFGCAGAPGPRQCLTTFPKPDSQDWSTGWNAAAPGAAIRLLREHTFASAFWTRGSADGRYVAMGGGPGAAPYRSTVIDLMTNREIPAAAQYDPAFTPDNVAFMLQGGSAKICEQSMLATAPQMISFTEAQCSTTNAIGLYQHIGASRGGDYWAVAGNFVSDNIGHNVSLNDVGAGFNSDADITLTPFVHTGTSFVPRPGIDIDTPREGDITLSGTARLLIGRINGGNSRMIGYTLRSLRVTPSGNTYQVETPELARYCVRGGKPAFSFDDRWMVYHHVVEAADWQSLGYASATDPAFVALRQRGAANVFLLDLVTGVSRRITAMNPGQYALYPFFRSDGWIYFLVRDLNRDRELVVASDAALELEGP